MWQTRSSYDYSWFSVRIRSRDITLTTDPAITTQLGNVKSIAFELDFGFTDDLLLQT